MAATICHDDKLPSASIATHLDNFREKLARASERLDELEQEWDSCVGKEKAAVKEMKAPETDISTSNHSVTMEDFKKEVEEIIKAKCRALEKIETVYSSNII